MSNILQDYPAKKEIVMSEIKTVCGHCSREAGPHEKAENWTCRHCGIEIDESLKYCHPCNFELNCQRGEGLKGERQLLDGWGE